MFFPNNLALCVLIRNVHFCHIQNPKCSTLKPIKCISKICSNKYHRKSDFVCSYQLFGSLLVLCIIFYQCISAMICTLYCGQSYAFIISKSQGNKSWNQSQHSERLSWGYCSFAKKTFRHSVYIALMACFLNKLHLLGKGSSSFFQTYGLESKYAMSWQTNSSQCVLQRKRRKCNCVACPSLLSV